VVVVGVVVGVVVVVVVEEEEGKSIRGTPGDKSHMPSHSLLLLLLLLQSEPIDAKSITAKVGKYSFLDPKAPSLLPPPLSPSTPMATTWSSGPSLSPLLPPSSSWMVKGVVGISIGGDSSSSSNSEGGVVVVGVTWTGKKEWRVGIQGGRVVGAEFREKKA